jgi:hypothetical protein
MSACIDRAAAGITLAVVLFAAMVLTTTAASAQPSLNVTFGRALNTLTTSDRQSTGGTVDLEQRLGDERVRLFYSLEGGDYTTPGDWRFYQNECGATWQARKADSAGPAIYTGASAVWRTNGDSWAAADYRAVGFFANAEWKSVETRTIRAGYRLDLRRFPDMPVLDQVEHEGFGSILLNLPTRTTLIAELQGGAKRYDVLEPATQVVVSPPVFTPGAGGGMGRGIGAMARASGYVVSAPGVSAGAVGGTAGQVTVLGRVAQSLAERVGVALQYSHRGSFGALPTAVVTTPALFFDDGVYDDPFASDADNVRGTFTYLLQNGMKFQAQGSWTGKHYRGTDALDQAGITTGALREDRIALAGASWTVPILRERTGTLDLGIVFDYQFTRQQSNDVFYNYASHAAGVAFAVSY